MANYNFTKSGKGEKFTLSIEEIKAKYKVWLERMPFDTLQHRGPELNFRAFLIDHAGLNAVIDEPDFFPMKIQLDDLFNEVLRSKDTGEKKLSE